MELVELAQLVGTGAATFGATWATLIRPMSKRAADPTHVTALGSKLDELRGVLDELKTAVTRVETKLEAHEKSAKNSDRKVEKLEERLARTVTDEEFAAYTRQTTTALSGLTERVGRAIGALDALR